MLQEHMQAAWALDAWHTPESSRGSMRCAQCGTDKRGRRAPKVALPDVLLHALDKLVELLVDLRGAARAARQPPAQNMQNLRGTGGRGSVSGACSLRQRGACGAGGRGRAPCCGSRARAAPPPARPGRTWSAGPRPPSAPCPSPARPAHCVRDGACARGDPHSCRAREAPSLAALRERPRPGRGGTRDAVCAPACALDLHSAPCPLPASTPSPTYGCKPAGRRRALVRENCTSAVLFLPPMMGLARWKCTRGEGYRTMGRASV